MTGLDHRVGHLRSVTAPGNHWFDLAKGCTKSVPSPSLAMYVHHERGLRSRR